MAPPVTPAADGTDALLRDVLTELRAIRAALEQRQPAAASLSRADHALLARLLPAIGGVFGSELFVTRDLFESDAAALPVVLGTLNARQVGRLFGRGAGVVVDGYLIERGGIELNAVLWRVLRAPEFPEFPHVTVPPPLTDGRR